MLLLSFEAALKRRARVAHGNLLPFFSGHLWRTTTQKRTGIIEESRQTDDGSCSKLVCGRGCAAAAAVKTLDLAT